MTWGQEQWGNDPYGGVDATFDVLSAVALNSTTIEVTFSQSAQVGGATILPGSYSIPGLVVHQVIQASLTVVWLIVTNMVVIEYTLTVSDVLSESSHPLSETVATFFGLPPEPQASATAQSTTKVQIVFSNEMLNNFALTHPANYVVSDLNGNAITVNSVEANGVDSIITRVTLVLASALAASLPYTVTIAASVHSIDGVSVSPLVCRFEWTQYPATRSANISSFSGELRGGIFGNPEGQVFFSPSYTLSPVGGTVLQVESVSVCTKAYDQYLFPALPDPSVFCTYGGSQPGILNDRSFGLWANFYQLGEAKHSLSDAQEDTYDPPVDGTCVAVLSEPLDTSKISLLTNSHWKLFDGTFSVDGGGAHVIDPTSFKTADVSAPIGPGTTTTTTLVP